MAAANPLPPPDPATALDPPRRSWLESMSERIARLTPEDDAAIQRLSSVRAEYGKDFARELEDFRAGRHPLQRPRG